MAVTTLKGHVSRALDFYDKVDIYFGLGKTTPWLDESGNPDESNPPTPKNTDELIDPAGYKKVESKFLVVPSDDGTGELTYRNSRWKIVPYDKALEKGARWVYVSSFIAYSEFPTDMSYRQIAVFTRLKVADDTASGKSNLLPEEVADPGIIEVIDNRTPVYREADQREKLVVIIEF